MPNLFNLIKPRGTKESSQRNNFDLYNAHAYSQKAGVIDPVKCIHTVPKDFFEINIADSTQTFAMNSAAFLKARKEISAYYVPYNYIWSNFNQYQATREDPKSAILQAMGVKFEPRTPLYGLYLIALELFAGYIRREYFYRLVALNQWIEDRPFGVDITDFDVSDQRFQHFLKVQQAAYDQSLTGTRQFQYITNVSTFQLISGVSDSRLYKWFDNGTDVPLGEVYLDPIGCYRWSYWLRKLDMLGYGNLVPLFDSMLIRIKTVYDSYVNTAIAGNEMDPNDFWSSDNLSDTVMGILAAGCKSLKQSCIGNSDGATFASAARMVSVYPLFAYNHVFYHMFRNSYYDLNYDVRNYNCDFLICTTLDGCILWPSMLDHRFVDLAHHQYKKDMFTGVLPDVQFGVVSKIDISGTLYMTDPSTNTGNDNFLFANTEGEVYRSDLIASGSSVSANNPGRTDFRMPSAFDVLALKRAEMLQVYHQNLMRAGNRTSDIFKAIYGSDPKSELHNTPYFVDVLGEDMNLDPVVSTADTGQGDNGSLGDIAARGLFGGNRSFKFSTEDFGCLLILAYVVPEPFYNSTRIDPHLMNLTPEDHLIPELMNLGFSPVLSEWLCNIVDSASKLNTVRGYAPPYLEFKTDISLAHGEFASAKLAVDKTNVNYDVLTRGSLSHWVATRIDMQSEDVTSLKTFYIHPNVLDSIFKQANDDTFDTDQFICLTKINCDAVRQFSKLGLPSF